MSKIAVGIDLGTSNTVVSVVHGNKAHVIPDREGRKIHPSVVSIHPKGDILVGQEALRRRVIDPVNTVYSVKRLIGRQYRHEAVQTATRKAPYGIEEGENQQPMIKSRGKVYTIPEISAFVLRHVKALSEQYLGQPVEHAVITVPANFNDAQREATKAAGRIAGLNVLRILNEPTAAAVAYGLDQQQDGIVAIYDLGGGTFDVSIMELAGGVFRVLSTSGDTFLGGEDFDRRIIDALSTSFLEEHGIELRDDDMALQRLREAAERAKHELSTQPETEISLPFITSDASGPKHLEVRLTRAELEELVADLVDRTLDPCQEALDAAELTVDDIDDVILVGGMTRMPLVMQSVMEFFRLEPHTGLNPDEVVSVGASIQGAVLRGELTEVLLVDVLPLTLGVETMGGVFTPLIDKNTSIPCQYGEVFSTAVDNQPMVSVHVLQGERPMAADNHSLARFDLIGIPPAPRGVPQIEVIFAVDANGILSVTAVDLGSGKEQNIWVAATGGLSDGEIDSMIVAADSYAHEDDLRREVAELRNRAAGLIYTSDRSLREYSEYLNPAEQENLKRDIAYCRQMLESDDPDVLADVLERLEASAHRIAEAMYSEMVYAPDEE